MLWTKITYKMKNTFTATTEQNWSHLSLVIQLNSSSNEVYKYVTWKKSDIPAKTKFSVHDTIPSIWLFVLLIASWHAMACAMLF